VDSGASRHMTRLWASITIFLEENLGLQVELGDNTKYAFKGVGTTSLHLESGNSLRMSDMLYVLGLKKNLLYTSFMEDIGYAITFSSG
jgi:hypothetical protein